MWPDDPDHTRVPSVNGPGMAGPRGGRARATREPDALQERREAGRCAAAAGGGGRAGHDFFSERNLINLLDFQNFIRLFKK